MKKENNGVAALILGLKCMAIILALGIMISVSLPNTIYTVKHTDVARDIVAPLTVQMTNLQGTATGFHLRYGNRIVILTNRHVCEIEGSDSVGRNIIFGDQIETVIAVDEVHDLCVVTSHSPIGLRLSNYPAKELDKIITVGFPKGYAKIIRNSRVAKYTTVTIEKDFTAFTIPVPTYGGQSGSPVTNLNGDVIGVVFAATGLPFPIGAIVPLEDVKIFLNKVFPENLE
jgi:serine protease Do